ncbi:MAG: bifunctional oligoribonuclease/PAP phosphatase NrnA [Sedimentisphaerales bacterium]|nr:bifunctional oligoribonuclease/PAP phosphatase NrnA [Sedimentisphaerales bacterium]
MANSDDFKKAVELINKSGSTLITTHIKPDGDACGCVAALCDALRRVGKKVQPLFLSAVPQWYSFMLSEKAPVLGEDASIDELMQGRLGEFDLIIIVDADSYSQLGDFEQYLKQNTKPVLVIDHHATSDGLGDVQILDSTAAATGLIVLELFDHAAWPVTETIAQALFTAIATDTGWFQFNNTDSRVYAAAARFTDDGAKPTKIYEKLYHSFSHARFNLMLAMLATLELHFDGRFATQHILLQDFERTGTTSADTENLINECHRIGTIEASALFVELKDGRIRCSLRSRGAVDVSKIAEKFGGGGHKPAAGAFLPGPLQNAKERILDEMSRQF